MNTTTATAAFVNDQVARRVDATQKPMHDALPFRWEPGPGVLADYVRLWQPTTDAPRVYHVAAGLTVLSTIVEHRVWLPHGGERLLPNVFVLILGPSSFYRKTTAINKARLTIRWVHDDGESDRQGPILPDEFSREALLRRLSDRPQGLLTFSEFSGALAQFGRDYMSGTRELLADLYDSPPVYTRLVGSQTYTLRNTCLSILAASQTDWLLEKLKATDMRGGFLARFAMWPAFSKATSIDLPPDPDAALRAQVIKGLNRMRRVGGAASLHPDAARAYGRWRLRHEQELNGSPRIGDLSPFWTRLETMVLKFSVLLQLATDQHLIVTEAEMSRAIALAEFLKTGLRRLFEEEFAFSDDMRNRQKVLRAIQRRPGITQRDLLRASSLLVNRLRPIVDTLKAEGSILDEDGKYYPDEPVSSVSGVSA